MLTPHELIHRLAALIPPPRRRLHRYYRVLAPNVPLRAAVTALAGAGAETPETPVAVAAALAPSPPGTSPEVAEEPDLRRVARYAWALLLARIYRVRPSGPTGAGLRIRSAHRLVDTKTRRAAVARHGVTRGWGDKPR